MSGSLAVALVLMYTTLTVIASVGFANSAAADSLRSFLTGQVVGNLAGFASVLALTGLLRLVPVHVAYPITQGMAAIGVQVVSARLIFHEAIDPAQWLGTGLIVAGIVLIGSRA